MCDKKSIGTPMGQYRLLLVCQQRSSGYSEHSHVCRIISISWRDDLNRYNDDGIIYPRLHNFLGEPFFVDVQSRHGYIPFTDCNLSGTFPENSVRAELEDSMVMTNTIASEKWD